VKSAKVSPAPSGARASIIAILVLFVSSCFASVRTGLDNCLAYKHIFSGKRIGIVANHTSFDSNGKYIVDIFRAMPNVTVTALFSPEHGLYGAEEAGREIDSKADPNYKMPVFSLYGNTRKPTSDMLKNVDILVFDIQDIGIRFYTYIYTMSLSMEAAAELGKSFVVLDRPNPINGLQVEGNVLKGEFDSFVGLHPIAVRHGMTVGEMAKMFNEEGWLADRVKANLTIIPMNGWHRRMWYDQTGLPFIKPSPNILNLETATVYPAICLLEGTNVSEGRGTNLPFNQFGAPWINPPDVRRINAETLAARLNDLNLAGFRFEPTFFTPTSSKYAGQTCQGARIVVTDRNIIEPYWSGIQVVETIYRMHPDKFEWKAEHFDRLCGTSAIREAIINHSDLKELKKSWQPERTAFLKVRSKYLIYSVRKPHPVSTPLEKRLSFSVVPTPP
jgi:uncharacterized protein YbbC (DUF1343 family)